VIESLAACCHFSLRDHTTAVRGTGPASRGSRAPSPPWPGAFPGSHWPDVAAARRCPFATPLAARPVEDIETSPTQPAQRDQPARARLDRRTRGNHEEIGLPGERDEVGLVTESPAGRSSTRSPICQAKRSEGMARRRTCGDRAGQRSATRPASVGPPTEMARRIASSFPASAKNLGSPGRWEHCSVLCSFWATSYFRFLQLGTRIRAASFPSRRPRDRRRQAICHGTIET